MDSWDEVTVIRKKPASTSTRASSNVTTAMRTGGEIETSKKCNALFLFLGRSSLTHPTPSSSSFSLLLRLLDGAGQNRQPGAGKDTAKLDRETEDFHRQFFPFSFF